MAALCACQVFVKLPRGHVMARKTMYARCSSEWMTDVPNSSAKRHLYVKRCHFKNTLPSHDIHNQPSNLRALNTDIHVESSPTSIPLRPNALDTSAADVLDHSTTTESTSFAARNQRGSCDPRVWVELFGVNTGTTPARYDVS